MLEDKLAIGELMIPSHHHYLSMSPMVEVVAHVLIEVVGSGYTLDCQIIVIEPATHPGSP